MIIQFIIDVLVQTSQMLIVPVFGLIILLIRDYYIDKSSK